MAFFPVLVCVTIFQNKCKIFWVSSQVNKNCHIALRVAAIHSSTSDRHLEKKNGMGYVNIGHFRIKCFKRLCEQVAHEEMVFMLQSTEGALLEKPSVYDFEGSGHKELK